MYILLYCFWLLLNGKINWEICLLGLAIIAAMALLEYILFDYTPRSELTLLKKMPLLCLYIVILLWEIIKASAAVLGIIAFRGRRKVEPTLVTFRAGLKTELGRFLLANSITLTPGTITTNVDGDRITVHCLDRSMLDTTENGVFQRWIRKLEA